MSTMTLWGANQFAKMLFGSRAPLPDSYYLALAVRGNPNPFMSGSEMVEPIGGGYQRLKLVNDTSVWGFDDYQSVYNHSKLTFTEATLNWGPVSYWALCDAGAEGNVYCYGGFANAVTVMTGDVPVINPGALRITMAISSSARDQF